MAICLVVDEPMRRRFVQQVDTMASLAESQAGEVLRSAGLVVSSSHVRASDTPTLVFLCTRSLLKDRRSRPCVRQMDVHALAAIFATYLSAWKGDKLWLDPHREGCEIVEIAL